ncbi:alpha/beta fold hydrolase [Halioxenophilus aromaticivorans]|uniref:Alpha/beta hydrolase n=1 Tax=Halioxenophilus aromaticivorans TaxID=1306992 RepID=A0AAV3TXB9_9ALTE
MYSFVGSENNRIATDIIGNSCKQPIILMHGGGQTRHSWRDSALILAAQNHFVISVDMRGHGDSDWVTSQDYSLQAAAADIEKIISGLDVPPILVGASYGGLVSLYLAGTKKYPIKAMVLVDVVAKINPEGVKPIRDFMQSRPDGFFSLDEAADSIAEYLPHRKKPTNLDGLEKNLKLNSLGRYIWHWDPAFMDSTETDKIYMELSFLNEPIDIPAILIKGTLSDVVNEEGIQHLTDIIPDMEFVEVDKAGHMIAGDKNTDFQDAVLKFIKTTV